jgi:uncharacterized membrane protein
MLKRIFISGLAALIPLVITIYVIVALFQFADGILGERVNSFLYKYVGYKIPGLGIVFVILIVFLLGLLIQISRMRVFSWFSRWFEQMLFKIPLVNKIYFPVKKVVHFLFYAPPKKFQRAVLVHYPRTGVYVVGFLTNENTLQFKEKGDKKFYNVFIPSSPSPITGFTIIAEAKDLIFLDIGVDEAIKIVVSGGLLSS